MTLFTGLNALIAGKLFIIDPGGNRMGLTTEYLQSSPFTSYLIPGLTLFTVIGIGNLTTTIFLFRKASKAPFLLQLQGILLTGWILIQMIMVRDINFLHIIMGSIGIIQYLTGRKMQGNN
ncbi:MAG: hypothetical protein U0Y08_00625 [Bacteroidia bacterium]